jgi:hypothetical protein
VSASLITTAMVRTACLGLTSADRPEPGRPGMKGLIIKVGVDQLDGGLQELLGRRIVA